MALGYVPVILPSLGLLYDGKLPDGRAEIRKMSVGEEIILQSTVGGVALVSALLQACVKLPSGLPHGELLLGDRMALLIALRVHTFGPQYGYSFNCQACGALNKTECNLGADLSQSPASPGLVEPIEVPLKDAGISVSLRFLRGKDEDQVAKVAKRTAMASNDLGDPSLITRMALQIVKIDGKDVPELAAREKFVREMTMTDGIRFRKALDSKEPHVNLGVSPECKTCGSVNELSLPFTLDFFRPSGD